MKTENQKQLYEFTKDYPLGGHKKGDQISLPRQPSRKLSEYVQPVGAGSDEEVPDETWIKADIVQWLASKGVTDVSESNTKDELLKAVKKALKG